jgi:K+-transporting ATPase KdpF subunit
VRFRGGLREIGKQMMDAYEIAGLVAVGLLVYLIHALLKAEDL